MSASRTSGIRSASAKHTRRAAAMLGLITACSGDRVLEPGVASVTVTPSVASVLPGTTLQLTATVRDASDNVLSGRTVAWSSSNTSVATVDGSGLVTGVTPGTTTVTATSEGQSGAATITVAAAVQPVLTSISRDAGSAAGGAVVLLDGSNFVNGAVAVFGGTNATTTFVSSTELRAAVPPHSTGVVSVSVTQTGLSSTLTNAFEYLPGPTTIYFNSDFEGGTLSPFYADLNGAGSLALSTDVAFSGTHSVRSSTDATGGNAGLAFAFTSPANAPVAPNGLYMRWYVYVPTATYNAVQGTGGQIKMHLFRQQAGSGQPGWLMCGIGTSFTQNGPFTCFVDNTILSFTGSNTGARVGDGIWLEIETWYLRSGGTGRARMWINGKAAFDVTNTLMGYDDPTVAYWARFGGVYVYGASGPTNVYVDNVKAGNGFIDP